MILLECLPRCCFAVARTQDDPEIVVGTLIDAKFIGDYSMSLCAVLYQISPTKFVIQQVRDTEATLFHEGHECHDVDACLQLLLAFSREYINSDRDIRIDHLCECFVQELRRAEKKHPKWTNDAVHGAGILAEESGEAMQAAVDFNASGNRQHLRQLEEETIQTGAMCLRLLLNMHNFRKPIDFTAMEEILADMALDDNEKLFEIQRLIKG